MEKANAKVPANVTFPFFHACGRTQVYTNLIYTRVAN